MKAFYSAKGNARRKDPAADSRCVNFLSGLKISQLVQKRQMQLSLGSARPTADSLLLCSLDLRGHLAVFIRDQHHLRHVAGDGCCLSHKPPVGDHRHIGGNPVLGTTVDLDRAPPGLGVMAENRGRNEAEG